MKPRPLKQNQVNVYPLSGPFRRSWGLLARPYCNILPSFWGLIRKSVFVPESRQVANVLRVHTQAIFHKKTPTLPPERLYTSARFFGSCEQNR